MKVTFSTLLLAAGICGFVVGHSHHDGEKQVPLHEQEFVQDSEEELERKWNFEVS
jgi:agmatinase